MPTAWPFPARTILSDQDLQSIVLALPEVPGRDQGRARGVLSEAWILGRYLAGAVAAGEVSVPLRVVRRESPDIELDLSSGSRGIEITESVDETYSAALVIRDRLGYTQTPDPYRFIQAARAGALSPDDARAWVHHVGRDASPLRRLEGDGYRRGQTETLWAQLVAERVAKKCNQVARGHYAPYERTDLLVYDNTMLDVDVRNALEMLAPLLPANCPFHAVSILTGAVVAALSPKAGWSSTPRWLCVPVDLIS